jgi:hypothetical protein
MTEAEWLACDDPEEMLNALGDDASDRKLRLITCESMRRVYPARPDDDQRAIALSERWADGQATDEEIAAFNRATLGEPTGTRWVVLIVPALEAIRSLFAHTDGRFVPFIPPLLRECLGNPFRPVTFSPAWRTEAVVALASQMYESRDFASMPILADALEDAGCDSADIIAHCRDPKGAHVRGCWVVDLVLGKE